MPAHGSPPPRRRAFLLAGLAGTVKLAGCLAGDADDRPAGTPVPNDSTDHVHEQYELPDACPTRDNEEFQCGHAEPISTSRDYDGEAHHTYHDNETVEICSVQSGGECVGTEVMSFEEWAHTRCLFDGGNAATGHVRQALDSTAGVMSGVGRSVHPDDQIGANTRVYIGDDDAIEDPVSLEEAVAIAPAFVETTVTIADREYECDVPVFVGTYDQLPRPDL